MVCTCFHNSLHFLAGGVKRAHAAHNDGNNSESECAFWSCLSRIADLLGCRYKSVSFGETRSPVSPYHTVEYDPFIKSQLASHNYLYGLMRLQFDHVTLHICLIETRVLDRVDR